jgi:hypothetical protein
MLRSVLVVLGLCQVAALIPFIDGGKGMPKLYDGWFNEQVGKQAGTAVAKALAAGKRNIEVNFPAVPNVDGKYGSSCFVRAGNDDTPCHSQTTIGLNFL